VTVFAALNVIKIRFKQFIKCRPLEDECNLEKKSEWEIQGISFQGYFQNWVA
jgi:hypothetical protein